MADNRTFIALVSELPEQRTAGTAAGAYETTTALYRQFGHRIFRWLTWIWPNATDAEDITQGVFLRLFETLENGQTVQNPKAWLFTAARRDLIDRIRTYHYDVARRDGLQRLRWQRESPTPEEILIQNTREKKLRQALRSLTPHERRCLFERARGLKLREISELVDLDTRRVSEEIARVCRKLRGQIDA